MASHGVDLVQIARIERLWREHGDRFLTRVFTPAERAYCLDSRTPAERLAGRFAAKEAVLKVLGTGWRAGIGWADVETLPDALGRPVVTLHGVAAQLAAAAQIGSVIVSISHSGDYVLASAIGLRAPVRA
ncbi:MAG: holo-ACP synthase [Phycisphaerae bacterium]